MINFLWATLFFVILWLEWCANIFTLPGNWLMLATAVIYWAFMPADSRPAIGVELLAVLAALAVLGEFAELGLSSAGVSKAGGSRRSALFAILGSIVGALVGLLIGVPIPVVGSIVGSLLFGSLGAMAGAILGEWSSGRDWSHSFQVGQVAFLGRALGTLAKLAIGLAMVAVALIGLLF